MAVHGISWLNPLRRHEKRVVILRNDGLGDFVISMTAMGTLSRHFRSLGYRISLVTAPAFAKIAQQSGYFDDITPCRVSDFIQFSRREKIEFMRRLYSPAPEIIVSLLGGDTRAEADMMLTLSNAKGKYLAFWGNEMPNILHSNSKKMKFCSDLAKKRQAKLANKTNVLAIREHQEDIFQYENRLVAAAMGASVSVEIQLDHLDWLEIARPASLPEKYYVLSVGGTKSMFFWPQEKFAEIIQRLHGQHPDLVPVFIGSAEEGKIADEIIGKTKEVPAINLCGKTAIEELFGIIKYCKFVFGHDSGPMNVAGILNVPSVCLVSGLLPGFYFPNKQYPTIHCLTKDMPCRDCRIIYNCGYGDQSRPCIAQISTNEVYAEISGLAAAD